MSNVKDRLVSLLTRRRRPDLTPDERKATEAELAQIAQQAKPPSRRAEVR